MIFYFRTLLPKFTTLPQRAITCQAGLEVYDQYKDHLVKTLRRWQSESFDVGRLTVTFESFNPDCEIQRVDLELDGLSLVNDYIWWEMAVPQERPVPEERDQKQTCPKFCTLL